MNKFVSVRTAFAAIAVCFVMVACAAFVCLSSDDSEADETKCGDNLYYTDLGGSLNIQGDGPMYDYPKDGNPSPFAGKEYTVVVISGATTVGAHAFDGTKVTSNLHISSEKIDSIGSYSFANADISSISVNENLKTVGDHAFFKLNLSNADGSINFDDKVETIGDSAFAGSNIREFTAGTGVKTIGAHAFDGCGSLTHATFNGNVETIGASAFENCKALMKVHAGTGVIEIGDSAFKNCAKFYYTDVPEMGNEIVDFGDKVTSIGAHAFEGCKSIENPNFGYNVTSLGAGAFKDCTGLTNVTLTQNLENVEDSTFEGCVSLKNLNLGSNVKAIGNNAFSGCEVLSYVNTGSGVTTVGNGAFEKTSLTSYEFAENVESIGERAFAGTGLSKVVVGPKTTVIATGTYSNCFRLASIEIGYSVTMIGSQAFAGCTGLTNVSVSPNVTSVATDAFDGITFYDKDRTTVIDTTGIIGHTFGGTADSMVLTGDAPMPTPTPETTYSVSYELDGGTGEVPGATQMASGTVYTVDDAVPTKDGKDFQGWLFDGKTYHGGDTLNITGNTVFTAQWNEAGSDPVNPDTPVEPGDDDDSSSGGDNTLLYVAIAVIAIVAVLGVLYFFVIRKK